MLGPPGEGHETGSVLLSQNTKPRLDRVGQHHNAGPQFRDTKNQARRQATGPSGANQLIRIEHRVIAAWAQVLGFGFDHWCALGDAGGRRSVNHLIGKSAGSKFRRPPFDDTLALTANFPVGGQSGGCMGVLYTWTGGSSGLDLRSLNCRPMFSKRSWSRVRWAALGPIMFISSLRRGKN